MTSSLPSSGSTASDSAAQQKSGVIFGLCAYGIWGLAPAYWKALHEFSALELLAQRVLWSGLIAIALLALTRGFRELRSVVSVRRHALPIAGASFLLLLNWLVFIYAVNTDRVTATSLGYYLNPLISVVLGLVVLGERLRPVQWAAVAIAAFGVGQYVVTLGELPWISVVLAASFGLYGLVRKMSPVEPVTGFSIEMAALTIPSLALLGILHWLGRGELPTGELSTDALVAASGLVTAAPLLCFNAAARRLPLVTVGILQYIAPSIALALAVAVWGEPFERVHAITFGCVWVALAIFTFEAFRQGRR